MKKIIPIIAALLIVFAFAIEIGLAADPWQKKRSVETRSKMAALRNVPVTIANWPPAVGKPFPDVKLFDHQGKEFSIQRLSGKPVLIEMVAMTCAGCQGFSGGNIHGGFKGFAVQKNLKSIEEYYRQYTGGHSLFSDEISFIQIVVYNLALKPPTSIELDVWRKHFRFDAHPNTYIVSGGESLANKASYKMIPGFLLLDSELKVLFDSTGHQPIHNMYTELLPAVPGVLAGGDRRNRF